VGGCYAYVFSRVSVLEGEALKIVAHLRQEGITTEMDLMGRNMSKIFKHAGSMNARKVIIVGEKELSQGAVAVRDMDSGDQTLVKKEELLSKLR
jgi:histidyl-tRNA synthetase